jgi:hypothetical protein
LRQPILIVVRDPIARPAEKSGACFSIVPRDRVYEGIESPKARRRRKEWERRGLNEGWSRIANAREVVLGIGTGFADQIVIAWMPQFLRILGGRVEKLRVVPLVCGRSEADRRWNANELSICVKNALG